ncbi:Sodium/hydrogen exchanger [Caligus rogercresseyi]|uniref:Sodium/hydrogen exchanger n=1 Tax=Caligus rogercresseyi TaxID=217165 RepID=A0A7T8KHY6_CALRO|nr:Sodium/hydrogen exchanger [Caligus rogercresseyi]
MRRFLLCVSLYSLCVALVHGEESNGTLLGPEVVSSSPLNGSSSSLKTTILPGNDSTPSSSSDNFLPATGDAEKEHSSSLAIFFLLCIIISCIFFIHCVLKTEKCRFIPESLAIVLFGAAVGLFMRILPNEDIKKVESFSPNAFFLVLLPPIIFESGYNLHKGDFFQNLGSILLFAIVGTTISALVVGGGVYLLGLADLVYKLDFVQSFAFGSLISAVDPVATLAIFQAMDVDPILNMLVFGESILNDAVAIVLTSTVIESGSESMSDSSTGEAVLRGIWRFLVVFLGSAGIGTLVALISSLLLKYADLYHNPSLEFAFMVCFVYSPYALAEGIHLSGIMSILFCGIVMSQYTHFNLSPVTQITLQQTMRTLAFMCESCVFAYLGLALFSFPHRFELALIVWSIIFTLIGRAFNIFPLAYLCNQFRVHRITPKMMLIMWFSGLRGAIAYALSLHLEFDEDTRKVIVTTTLTVVLFTTMILGGGTMPLMKYLETRKMSGKKHKRRRKSAEKAARRRKEVLLSKTLELSGSGGLESSELSHLSELTEEELETSSTFKIGKNKVRGFTYWNYKYIKPFLIRKFTQRELKDGKSQVTELTDKWFKDIHSSPLLLSDSSEESDIELCSPAQILPREL